MSRKPGREKEKNGQSVVPNTTISTAAQLVQKALNAVTKCYSVLRLRLATQPYLWVDLTVIQVPITSLLSDGFVWLRQQQAVCELGLLLYGADEVDDTARNSSPVVDGETRFLSYAISENLSDFITNNSQYSLCD